jgi:hypothetical protein
LQGWWDRDRNMNMSLNTAHFMKDQTPGFQRLITNKSIESRLYRVVNDWQVSFDVPNKMKIDFGVRALRHGSKPAKSGLWSSIRCYPAVKRLG